MLLGKLLQELPEHADQAIEALHQAADLRPGDPEPRMLLAAAARPKGQPYRRPGGSPGGPARRKDGETLLLGQVHVAPAASALAVPALQEASAYLPGDLNVRELAGPTCCRGRPQGLRHPPGAAHAESRRPHLLLMVDAGDPPQLPGSPGWQGRHPAHASGKVETLLDENQTRSARVLLIRASRTQRAEWLSCAWPFLKDP